MDIENLKLHIISLYQPFNPEKIILFGSMADENWDEHSDIDLIIVYPTSKGFLERLKELYLAWDIPRGVDILAYSPEEFGEMLRENYFIQDAIRKGQTLYARHEERM